MLTADKISHKMKKNKNMENIYVHYKNILFSVAYDYFGQMSEMGLEGSLSLCI